MGNKLLTYPHCGRYKEDKMNGQPQPYNNFQPIQQPKKPVGFAVTSFVLSLANILLCCCMTYILAPLSIIFGSVSIATKRGGKGLAVAGIVISSLTIIAMLVSNIVFKDVNDDFVTFAQNYQYYIDEYDETGEVPEEFQKYGDPKYDRFWHAMGFSGFDEFYGMFIENFKQQQYGYGGYDYGGSGESSYDDYGEAPVNI